MGNKKPPILTIPPTEPTIFRLPDRSSELLTLMARCQNGPVGPLTRKSAKCGISVGKVSSALGIATASWVAASCQTLLALTGFMDLLFNTTLPKTLWYQNVSNVTSHPSSFDYPLTTALLTDKFQPCKDYGNHTISSS